MSALLIAYLPEDAAQDLLLDGQRLRIGRAEHCAVRLPHPSVSREHAELHYDSTQQRWQLRDLGSKNGSFLHGQRITVSAWDGPAWLRFGEVLCEFRPLDAAAVSLHQARQQQRRATWQTLTERIERQAEPTQLLPSTLAAVLELAGCERGFVLLAEHGQWHVRERLGLAGAQLAAKEFAGSLSAVERTRQRGCPLVLNDAGQDAEFARRASVIAGDIRALVCLPLRAGEELLGVIYADSRQPGTVITALDLELLQAFVDRAGLWLAAQRGQAQLAALAADADSAWPTLLASAPASHAAR